MAACLGTGGCTLCREEVGERPPLLHLHGTLYRQGDAVGRVLAKRRSVHLTAPKSSMPHNDIDNGRSICVVGIASLKSAESVIFRTRLQTADKVRQAE